MSSYPCSYKAAQGFLQSRTQLDYDQSDQRTKIQRCRKDTASIPSIPSIPSILLSTISSHFLWKCPRASRKCNNVQDGTHGTRWHATCINMPRKETFWGLTNLTNNLHSKLGPPQLPYNLTYLKLAKSKLRWKCCYPAPPPQSPIAYHKINQNYIIPFNISCKYKNF